LTFAIDEKTRRRPDFLDGVPVRLADGQEWVLPKPKARFAFSGDGFSVQLSCGPVATDEDDVFGSLFTTYQSVIGRSDTTDMELIAVEMRFSAAILRRNYRLTDEELGRLLVFSYDPEDEPYYSMRAAILAVATGRNAPKP